MQLRVLQQQLQQIYEISIDHNIDDFLITDSRMARALDTSANPRAVNEKLLVCEDNDDLYISLYLHRQVMARLTSENPLFNLSGNNINQYCVAVEGVSHFLYLTYNAGYQRGVTLLELELQAEVDKYVGLSTLLRQQNTHMPDGLHRWLFDRISFDEELDAQQRERYRDANQFAAKYCLWLERHYAQQGPEMFQELRRFYRKTQGEKIRIINAYA